MSDQEQPVAEAPASPPVPEYTGPHVYHAMSRVMQRLTIAGIGKNKTNTQQNYKFRGVDDVYDALAPILAEERLLILPRMTGINFTEKATKSGGSQEFAYVTAEYDFVSALDGSKHTCVMYGEGMDSADKATNKAMTAAYKYLCFQAFSIPVSGLDDGDADGGRVTKGKSRKGSQPTQGESQDESQDQPRARDLDVGEMNLTAGMKKLLDSKLAKRDMSLDQLVNGFGHLPSSTNINDVFAWIDKQ